MGTFVWKRAHTIGAVAVVVLVAGGVALGATLGRSGPGPSSRRHGDGVGTGQSRPDPD